MRRIKACKRKESSSAVSNGRTFKPDDRAGWRGKILIIESIDAPMINEKERERLKATYPEADVYTFEGAGHLIPLLKLDEMLDVIRGFLRKDQIAG
jgi:hypothetical protein